MKLSSVKTDAAKIEGGDWVSGLSEMGDLELKVRGTGNAHYRRLAGKLVDALPRSKKLGGRIDPEENDRITSICLAETVLMDWRGLEDEDDNPIPFSKEKAKEFLLNPDYRLFRAAVIEAAEQVGKDETEARKDEEGNSASTQPGD